MPTCEYQCEMCGLAFEHRQAITEEPLMERPQCHGKIQSLVSSGAEALKLLDMHVRAEKVTAILVSGRTFYSVAESMKVSRL